MPEASDIVLYHIWLTYAPEEQVIVLHTTWFSSTNQEAQSQWSYDSTHYRYLNSTDSSLTATCCVQSGSCQVPNRILNSQLLPANASLSAWLQCHYQLPPWVVKFLLFLCLLGCFCMLTQWFCSPFVVRGKRLNRDLHYAHGYNWQYAQNTPINPRVFIICPRDGFPNLTILYSLSYKLYSYHTKLNSSSSVLNFFGWLLARMYVLSTQMYATMQEHVYHMSTAEKTQNTVWFRSRTILTGTSSTQILL